MEIIKGRGRNRDNQGQIAKNGDNKRWRGRNRYNQGWRNRDNQGWRNEIINGGDGETEIIKSGEDKTEIIKDREGIRDNQGWSGRKIDNQRVNAKRCILLLCSIALIMFIFT